MTRYPAQTRRQRRVLTHTQSVAASAEAIFPLLCPVLEREWIPGWECELVYTRSGVAELDCIFQTDRPADGGLDTWVISTFEPPRRIAFVRVNTLRCIHYDIRLRSIEAERTELDWTQVITALSEDGDRHVTAISEADFKRYGAGMQDLMHQYLQAA